MGCSRSTLYHNATVRAQTNGKAPWHLLALASWAAAACAGAQPQVRSSSEMMGVQDDPPRVLLVGLPGCCATPNGRRLSQALRQSLRQSARLSALDAGDSQLERTPARPGASISQVLARARTLYTSMHMTAARALLEATWRELVRTGARGATALELARLHAYLVAACDALGDRDGVAHHSQAAARYAPHRALRDDLLTPSVQQAIDRARTSQVGASVTIRSQPAGARVYWNGTARGTAPLTLKDQAKGVHLLRLEHPLAEDWAETIDLKADSELRPQLTLLPPGLIGARLREQPGLGAQAIVLLHVDALLLLEQHPRGLSLLAFDARGTTSRHLVADEEQSVVVASVLRQEILRARSASTHPATLPVARPATHAPLASAWATHARRYWWAYALGGAAAIGLGVSLPLALSAREPARDLLLSVP